MSNQKKEYVKGTQGRRVKSQIKKPEYLKVGFKFDSDRDAKK